MAKTKEELNELKIEVETIYKKLAELTDDELKDVTGGNTIPNLYAQFGQKAQQIVLKELTDKPVKIYTGVINKEFDKVSFKKPDDSVEAK